MPLLRPTVLQLALVLGAASAVPTQQTRPADPPGHLLVLVVVDQLRPDHLERARPGFSPDGGFRRLAEQGVTCVHAAYPYASTETGPGHASLATGAVPRDHGIIANSWVDPQSLEPRYCVGKGDTRSAEQLLCTTFAEELALAGGPGHAPVVSLSLKDRAAILMAGRAADGVFWFDDKNGQFGTSKACGSNRLGTRTTAVIEEWNRSHVVDRHGKDLWTRLLDPRDPRFAAVYAALPDDDNPFEQPPVGFRPWFDHQLPAATHQDYYALLKCTPFANTLLLELATRFVADPKLGLGRTGLSLLCVSFSSNDHIGHAFGPRSHEVLDATVRLDSLLKDLMTTLDQLVGSGAWTLALTADHGVNDIPELTASLGLPGGRVPMATPGGVLERVSRSLAERYHDRLPADFLPILGLEEDKGRVTVRSAFFRWEEPSVYLDHGLLRKHRIDAGEVAQLVRDQILAQPGVACAVLREDLLQGRYGVGTLAELLARSCHPRRSGDVLVAREPGWLGEPPTRGYATGHGSPNGNDRRVPMYLIGPAFKRGQVVREATSPLDIAATWSAVFSVPRPSACSGRVLTEALR